MEDKQELTMDYTEALRQLQGKVSQTSSELTSHVSGTTDLNQEGTLSSNTYRNLRQFTFDQEKLSAIMEAEQSREEREALQMSKHFENCEQELQDLHSLRFKTLESIIAEKIEIINQLENDLTKERFDNRKLEQGLYDKQGVLESYESRFLQVRSLIEAREHELQKAYEEIDGLKFTIERTDKQLVGVQAQLEEITALHRTEQDTLKSTIEDQEAEFKIKCNDLFLEYERKLRESEKRMEATFIVERQGFEEQLNMKSKEINQLQEQLADTYKDGQSQSEELQQKVYELSNDLSLKQKELDSKQETHEQSQALLQEHIEKLKQILQEKTDMNTQLDLQNQNLQKELNLSRGAVIDLEHKQQNLVMQNQEEARIMSRQGQDAMRQYEEDLNQLKHEHSKEKKQLERENEKLLRQFEIIKAQVQDKEKSFQQEIERALEDWEDKCNDLEDQINNERIRTSASENKRAALQKEIQSMEIQQRALQNNLADKVDEIRIIQARYERTLTEKEESKLEMMAKHKQVVDKLEFEIEYLKKELQGQMKQVIELKNQHFESPGSATDAPIVGLSTSFGQKIPYVEESRRPINDKKQPLSPTSNKSLEKSPLQPSPYVQEFVKSTFKQGSLNDSLDKLKNDFLNGYNDAMQESILGAGKSGSKGFQGFNVKHTAPNFDTLTEENEALKRLVEQMKIDMETIVDRVKEQQGDSNPLMQEAIIQKSQKIFELEKVIKIKDEQIAKLKQERERLISISNDIRADLNRNQRLVSDLMSKQENQLMNEIKTMVSPREQDLVISSEAGGIFSPNLPVMDSVDSVRQNVTTPLADKGSKAIFAYGQQVNDLALQIQEWLQNNQFETSATKDQDSPKRQPLQILKPKQKKRSRSKRRSTSRESKIFIQRIEQLRKNLEVEGQTLMGFYQQAEADRKQLIRQSDKSTVSQLQAQNKLLMANQRKLQEKQDREALIQAAKGKIRNYLQPQPEGGVQPNQDQNNLDLVRDLEDSLGHSDLDDRQRSNSASRSPKRTAVGRRAVQNRPEGQLLSKKIGDHLMI